MSVIFHHNWCRHLDTMAPQLFHEPSGLAFQRPMSKDILICCTWLFILRKTHESPITVCLAKCSNVTCLNHSNSVVGPPEKIPMLPSLKTCNPRANPCSIRTWAHASSELHVVSRVPYDHRRPHWILLFARSLTLCYADVKVDYYPLIRSSSIVLLLVSQRRMVDLVKRLEFFRSSQSPHYLVAPGNNYNKNVNHIIWRHHPYHSSWKTLVVCRAQETLTWSCRGVETLERSVSGVERLPSSKAWKSSISCCYVHGAEDGVAKSDWRDALQHVQVADFVKAKDCSKDQAEVRNAELSWEVQRRLYEHFDTSRKGETKKYLFA